MLVHEGVAKKDLDIVIDEKHDPVQQFLAADAWNKCGLMKWLAAPEAPLESPGSHRIG